MYTYQKLCGEIAHLRAAGVRTGVVGLSRDARPIPCVFAGGGKKIIFITAGIHAREHVGCYLVMKQAYYALNRLAEIKPYGGICFIPMLNPDGNEIVQRGADGLRRKSGRLCETLKTADRKLFKANADCVDLNVNFDAGWGTGKQNIRTPAAENYIGESPFSAPETKALRDFTKAHRPAATVSYHCIGREIYWEYGQTGAARTRDKEIAEYLNEKLDYKIVSDDGTSAGGYKDWCIRSLGIPAFTIELVSGSHTHPFMNYALAEEDIGRNLDLPIRLLSRVGTD